MNDDAVAGRSPVYKRSTGELSPTALLVQVQRAQATGCLPTSIVFMFETIAAVATTIAASVGIWEVVRRSRPKQRKGEASSIEESEYVNVAEGPDLADGVAAVVPRWETKGKLLFVYGSLLDPESLSSTIGRCLGLEDYSPARLRQHRLTWGACVDRLNMVNGSWEEISDRSWCSLVVQHHDQHAAPGAILEVTQQEFARLRARERSYSVVEVGSYVELLDGSPAPGAASVFTFKPRASFELGPTASVRSRYIEMVRGAYSRLGFKEELPTPPSVVDAYAADHEFGRAWLSAWGPQDRSDLDDYVMAHGCERRTATGTAAIPTLGRPFVMGENLYSELSDVAERSLGESLEYLASSLDSGHATNDLGIDEWELAFATLDESDSARVPQIARVDLLLERDRITLLEVNADSPAGLHHFEAIARWTDARSTRGMARGRVAMGDQPQALDMLVGAFLRRYRDYFQDANAVPNGVAILDYDPEVWPTRSEFDAIEARIEEAWGCPAVICDPRELSFDGSQLLATNDGISIPIDFVYKRALWRDLGREPSVRDVFMSAARSRAVCISNSMSSRLAGNKRILLNLAADANSVASEYVPQSYEFTRDLGLLTKVRENPDQFIVKAFRGHGAKDVIVFAGDAELNDWRDDVAEAFSSGSFLAQEIRPHGLMSRPFHPGLGDPGPELQMILGAYLIDGQCIGVEVKTSPTVPVTMNRGAARGIALPVVHSS